MKISNFRSYSYFDTFVAAFLMFSLALAGYFVLEPAVVSSAPADWDEEFTVTANITGEISIDPAPANVTMVPPIPGLTGGTANGSTTFSVISNNPAGYTVQIEFASTTAMVYNGTSSAAIPNINGTVVGNFVDTDANLARFGFTATGPNIVTALLGDSGTCGGGTASEDHCFTMNADATSPYTFVNSNAATDVDGDDFALHFRVVVEDAPSVFLPLGSYTATATVTAIEK